MSGPTWSNIGDGILGTSFQGADGKPVYLLKEVWESKSQKHENLEQNWDEFRATIEKSPGVYESRLMPDRRVYAKYFAKTVREDGRVGGGIMIVVVDRLTDRMMSAYIVDNFLGKIGKRLWP